MDNCAAHRGVKSRRQEWRSSCEGVICCHLSSSGILATTSGHLVQTASLLASQRRRVSENIEINDPRTNTSS